MSYREHKDADGYLYKEWINEKGRFRRDCGPAYICYYPDGSIWYEEFWLNGVFIGISKEGFWALWDRIPEEKRINYEVLKLISRYS